MPLVRLVEPQDSDPAAAPMLESGMAQYGMALNTWRALLHRPERFHRVMDPPLDMPAPPPAIDAVL